MDLLAISYWQTQNIIVVQITSEGGSIQNIISSVFFLSLPAHVSFLKLTQIAQQLNPTTNTRLFGQLISVSLAFLYIVGSRHLFGKCLTSHLSNVEG